MYKTNKLQGYVLQYKEYCQYFISFFFPLRDLEDLSSQTRGQIWALLQWKQGAPATGLLGNFLVFYNFKWSTIYKILNHCYTSETNTISTYLQKK